MMWIRRSWTPTQEPRQKKIRKKSLKRDAGGKMLINEHQQIYTDDRNNSYFFDKIYILMALILKILSEN